MRIARRTGRFSRMALTTIMKRALWAVSVLVAACGSSDVSIEYSPGRAPEGKPATIDEALVRRFTQAKLAPVRAEEPELCRRLYADFVGRFPSADEFTRDCSGKSAGDIAAALQGRAEYVVHSMRLWRDRLNTTDALIDQQYLAPAYEIV